MKKLFISAICILCFAAGSFAQSYYFGVKGGPTFGFQKWDGFERNVLFRYHGSVFIESASEPGEFALFAQAGYHQKGSSIGGGLGTDINGRPIRFSSQAFIFENIDLVLGVKQHLDFSFLGSTGAYYMFGVRGEYTVNNNLGDYQDFNRGYLPFPEYVREWNYGATLGGGFEFGITDYIGAILELSVHPDFSNQYNQPSIPNVRNPWTGSLQTLSGRTIRNTTFEISVGFRFLREIEYVD